MTRRHPLGICAVGVGISLAVWVRPVASLVVVSLWTVAVLRLVGIRATLGAHTFATYLGLGALLELVAAPFVTKILGPYASRDQLTSGTLAGVLLTLGFALALFPVVTCLFRTRVHAMTSVADAFLLAFATVAGTAMPHLIFLTGLQGMSFWSTPDLQFAFLPLVWPAWAYWSAMVALVMATTMKFVRPRYVGYAAGVVVFIYLANLSTGWIGFLWRVLLTRELLWGALIALALCSLLEWLWARDLEGRIERKDAPEAVRTRGTWVGLAHALPWLLLGLVFVAFPHLPKAWTSSFWTVATFTLPILGGPPLLSIVLMLVVARRYVSSMGTGDAPAGDANVRLRFHGHRMILQLSMGAVLLVLLNVDLPTFVAQDPHAPQWRGLGFDQTRLGILLLLLAVGAGGIAADAAPSDIGAGDRREATVRRASTLVQGLLVAWLGTWLGTSLLPAISDASARGEYFSAVATAIVSGGFGFLAALLLRAPATRLENVALTRLAGHARRA